MDLTDDERDLLLPGHFELTITYLEDSRLRERCRALVRKLDGDPFAMFFGAS